MLKIEQSLVLIKPDGVANKKIGRIITRLEDKELQIQAIKMVWLDERLLKEHYKEHIDKPFFARLLSYMSQNPVIAMVVAGESAIKNIRNLVGATDPLEAKPGSIRGDFALTMEQGNIIHASDSKNSAKKEINLFFDVDEIFSY